MGFETSVLCRHIPSYSRFPRTFRTRRAATADLSRLWQDGVIPYQIESNFTGVLLICTQKYVFVLQVNTKKKIKACFSTSSMIFMHERSFHSHSQYNLYQVPHMSFKKKCFFFIKRVNMINSKFCNYRCITFLWWCAFFYMHSFVYVQNVSPPKSHLCVCHASLGKLHVHHLRGKNNRTWLHCIYTKTMRVR